MKLPLSWLKEFVAIEAPLEELCRRLTVGGLEVENVEHHEPSFSGVVVAKVKQVERHPNADRLSLCQVEAGAHGNFSVVCGAPNVKAGMTAALALVGARLGKEAPLAAAVIRDVRSEGMLCSERELGLSAEHDGIISLPSGLAAGADFAEAMMMADTVLDIAITPNRGDCLSIVGVARDIAALFGAKFRSPKIKGRKKSPQGLAPLDSQPPHRVSVEIEAPDLCPRYAALAMSDIKIDASPVWLRRRLELCGMRALNNIVDITNYVMLELGQPLHAFDVDKIAGTRIIVRRAGNDREFITLDNAARTLDREDLLIADSEKPLAIAGVMGGLNSEVSDSTRNILLESAYFEPATIAKTARRLQLRSEASYRFERGIDRAGQVRALLRAAELIRKAAGGKNNGGIVDVEPRAGIPREILLDLNWMAS
ncbi:MAG TPA: phenylalanine--tRNA ligase subunit beta, partial [Candidatus Binataceae bacterium]